MVKRVRIPYGVHVRGVIGKNGAQIRELGDKSHAFFKLALDQNNDPIVTIHGTEAAVVEGERLLQELFQSLQKAGGY